MAVADHVDQAELFASRSDEFDVLNAALVDGRAVYFFLHFIEPWLLRMAPDAVHDSPGRGGLDGAVLEGGYAPVRHAHAALSAHGLGCPFAPGAGTGVRYDGVVPIDVLTRQDGPDPGLLDAPDAVVAEVERAIQSIAAVGLGYFVELAVGVIVAGPHPVTDPEQHDLPGVVWLDGLKPGAPGVDEVVLRQAAIDFLWRWAEVELHINGAGPHPPPHADPALRELADLFSRSVLWEYRRRRSPGGEPASVVSGPDDQWMDRAPSLLPWLQTLSTTPLCQELLAVWFPGWRRSLFIFNSPFDLMGELPRVSE